MDFGYDIAGNSSADKLAGTAAMKGRQSQYENPDKSLYGLSTNASGTKLQDLFTALNNCFPPMMIKRIIITKMEHGSSVNYGVLLRQLSLSPVV